MIKEMIKIRENKFKIEYKNVSADDFKLRIKPNEYFPNRGVILVFMIIIKKFIEAHNIIKTKKN